MITLYTFGPAFGLPDPSPFVMKAEMLLKLAGLEYSKMPGSMRKAPKGKLPYIEDNGAIIADSTFIRWHLEKKYRVDFDANLSPSEKGIAWAVEKLLEDNLYWVIVETRWMNAANFAKGPAQFFSGIPWPLRKLIVPMIVRKVRRNLHGQGLGRHNQQEIAAIAAKGISALASVLGDKPYLMGDHPCSADATAFAFAAHLLCPLFDTPSRDAAAAHPNLVAYAERMMRDYYPELVS